MICILFCYSLIDVCCVRYSVAALSSSQEEEYSKQKYDSDDQRNYRTAYITCYHIRDCRDSSDCGRVRQLR